MISDEHECALAGRCSVGACMGDSETSFISLAAIELWTEMHSDPNGTTRPTVDEGSSPCVDAGMKHRKNTAARKGDLLVADVFSSLFRCGNRKRGCMICAAAIDD